MKVRPTVSVIMAAYQAEPYIQQAVDSILNQNFGDFEICISDDGSTDKTRKIIDSIADARIRRFHNDKNLGLLTTWNKLLSESRGELITFQDADDVSLPGRIEKLVRFMNNNPEVGVCGTNFIRYYRPWGVWQTSSYPNADAEIRGAFERKIVPFNGTRVMVRRSIYEQVGGFREFFKGLGAEDYDWILRMAERTKVANLPDVLYEYRYYPKSASKYALNSPVEKMFVNEIVFFLAGQRAATGSDALQANRPEELQRYLEPFRRKLEGDFSNVMRYERVFSNALSNRDFSLAWSFWFVRLRNFPRDPKNFERLLRLLSVFARTIVRSIIIQLTRRKPELASAR